MPKNKSKSKSNNPQPKNEVSETPITEIPVENVPEEPELTKIAERVPEIVSEVVPSAETKVSESDTPKKPKRNRGRKKKANEKDDVEENQDSKLQESNQETKISSDIPENKNLQGNIELSENTPEVTPVARKMKNKNKKQQGEFEKPAQEEIKISPIKKGEEITDLKIITVVPYETEESKSKKKNKKKKRTDSERSEKADEVLACTAAFQKLLEGRDDKKDKKDPKQIETKSEETTLANEISKEADIVEKVKHRDFESKKFDIQESDNRSNEKEESGKSKKKNKKEKKQPPKIETEEECKFSEAKTNEKIEKSEQISSENVKISKECLGKDKPETTVQKEVPPKIEKELSPKPKAKIAKPVEKKRKGNEESLQEKQEQKSEIQDKAVNIEFNQNKPKEQKEQVQSQTSHVLNLQEVPEIKLSETKKSEEKPKEQQVETQPQVKTPETSEVKQAEEKPKTIEAPVTAPSPEFMSVPESGKNNRRKKSKSPKPKGQDHKEPMESKPQVEVIKTDISIPANVTDVQQTELAKETKDEIIHINVAPGSEKVPSRESEATLNIEIATAAGANRTMFLETPDPGKIPDIAKESTPDKHQHKENMPVRDVDSNKKRKKSPKPSKKAESSQAEKKDSELTPSTDPKEMPREQREKTSTSMPSLEDIEIISIKTDESEGSVCDVVPDVHYPRASSQADDINNNTNTMSIQEIPSGTQLNVPDLKLNVPSVQGSGETPLATPVPPATNTSYTTELNIPQPSPTDKPTVLTTVKKEPSPKPEEKTDLKSKVLDVNVGMEELRKSIERSLAELNAIEKSEKDAEEQFAQAQAKLEAISDMASKKNVVQMESLQQKQGKNKNQLQKEKSHMKNIPPSEAKPEAKHESKEKSPMKSIPPPQAKSEAKHEPKEKSPMKSIPPSQAKPEAKNETKEKPPMKSIPPLLATPEAKHEPKEKSPMKSIPPSQAKSEAKNETKEKSPLPSKKASEQPIKETQKVETKEEIIKPLLQADVSDTVISKTQEMTTQSVESPTPQVPPVCPARKDNRGKNKKKKGKQETGQMPVPMAQTTTSLDTSSIATTESKETGQESKKEEKSEQKSDSNKTQEKGKQQSSTVDSEDSTNRAQDLSLTESIQMDFEPVENFEDALISNNEANDDDVNKTFEMIASEVVKCDESQNPEINVTAPTDDDEKSDTKSSKDGEKINPVSQPKNLLGHPDIPARLNKTDYKKEKDKTPNTREAKVKIRDAVPIEVTKESKESQTENKRRFLKDKTVTETVSSVINDNEEYIYKYSFRKVFLPSACHVCKKDLKTSRVPCTYCNLIFYCSAKHKDEDYAQHQGFCFAVSTIVHLKDQKHIYADAKNISGHEYRLLRMQMIVSCEKVLKRRLTPWEQEALLYPRICADASCREWRQSRLVDCEGCAQIAYCSDNPAHLPVTHQRWCKSYALYHKLVVHQQTRGRLEPRLPSRVFDEVYSIPEKLNEVLASMYEEKIDMTDIQYAALTQIATAPLTAAYCQQLYNNKMNAVYANGVNKKSSFTIHVVGAELQFEADALNKWEVFFLHLRPEIKDLRLVLIGPDLNPSKLPLDLLGRIRMCENCRQNKRRVLFDFQDNKTYSEYWSSDFITPDLVCAFNPSIHRSAVFNGKDSWPATIQCILKIKVPFIITSYTMTELQRDLIRVKDCSEVDVTNISEPKYNAFASVRPDRNFISDDEMPLLFKNYCFSVICGSY